VQLPCPLVQPVPHTATLLSTAGLGMEQPTAGRETNLLRQFGLARNPFVDRTAERTSALEPEALYLHSDLQGFQPSGNHSMPLMTSDTRPHLSCLHLLRSSTATRHTHAPSFSEARCVSERDIWPHSAWQSSNTAPFLVPFWPLWLQRRHSSSSGAVAAARPPSASKCSRRTPRKTGRSSKREAGAISSWTCPIRAISPHA
jgi:hypothetical protein